MLFFSQKFDSLHLMLPNTHIVWEPCIRLSSNLLVVLLLTWGCVFLIQFGPVDLPSPQFNSNNCINYNTPNKSELNLMHGCLAEREISLTSDSSGMLLMTQRIGGVAASGLGWIMPTHRNYLPTLTFNLTTGHNFCFQNCTKSFWLTRCRPTIKSEKGSVTGPECLYVYVIWQTFLSKRNIKNR